MNPDYKGLSQERSFAFNALGQYEKAIPILQDQIKANLATYYTYKELSYAQLKTNQLESAAKNAMNGIKMASSDKMKAEMPFNVAYYYHLSGNKKEFEKWSEETLKWSQADKSIHQRILTLKSTTLLKNN